MIGVSEYYLSLDVVTELVLVHGLNATDSTYRHEDWCLYLAMVCRDEGCPGVRARAGMFKLEFERSH